MTSTTLRIGILATLIALGANVASADTHPNGAVFERLDRDNDGAVTREEMRAAAAARFAEADTDNDGFLTPQEMQAARGDKRASRMLERFDTDGNGQLSASELEAAADQRQSRRAARMLARMDTNEDGKLALDEMTAHRDPGRLFDRLDADNNGSLSAAEFAEARKMRGGKRRGD